MNLLIIPSWYPRPDDKINGCFFQEQAKLVTDCLDVKVLMFRFSRPSIRLLVKTPLRTGVDWMRYLFQQKSRVRLPNDEVFTDPPLIEYRLGVFGATQRQRHEKRLQAYLQALEELMFTGWKPDLIHAHSVSLGGLVAQRIKEVYGIPYVITEHVPFVLCNYPGHLHSDIKNAFKNAKSVLSLGIDTVRQLGFSGIYVETNLIYNLVDEFVFTKICSSYKAEQTLKLISIGSASHFKDHVTLLRALLVLKHQGIPFTLTLIGLKAWGDLYNETLEFIRSNDLEHDVSVIDRIDRADVCSYLASHHVFLMTSIFETFCVSIIEALATGLPVITTNHGGGSIDLITPKTGAVVPIRNYRAVADKLIDIYHGNIRFDPQTIRDCVIAVCGRDAFRVRLIGYYEQAMAKAS